MWEVDLLWGAISSINWKRRAEEGDVLKSLEGAPAAIQRASQV
jgi:hypothetical protein